MTYPAGGRLEEIGTIRAWPNCVPVGVATGLHRKTPPASIPYAIVSKTRPDVSTSSTSPDCRSLVGLIRLSSAVHPPPLAKCGITATAAAGAGRLVSRTGNDVIKKSKRSLITVRIAITAMGAGEVKARDPLKTLPALKG